jgi:hypothetical protein
MSIEAKDTLAQLFAKKTDFEEGSKSLTVTYDDVVYQADDHSIDQMIKTLGHSSLPSNFYWLDSSNNKVVLTKEKLQDLADSAIEARFNLFNIYQDARVRVNAATEFSELFF